jgi:hypothetical protein
MRNAWFLAATLATTVTASALAQAPMPFRCPVNGTVVELSTNVKVESLGADPQDPTVCVVRANNVERRLLYGFWRLPLTHHGAEASARAAFAQFYPAMPGKTVTYDIFLPRTGGGDDPYRETWTAIGIQPVTVRAGSFNAMVIERTQEGRGGNVFKGTWRRWVDVNTGVTVKQTFSLGRGNMPAQQEWEAISIVSPPPPAPPPAAPQQRPQRPRS